MILEENNNAVSEERKIQLNQLDAELSVAAIKLSSARKEIRRKIKYDRST